MAWLKRNLYFVIGSFVAVVLMGWAGLYLYQNLAANRKAYDEWGAQNAELQRLVDLNPHPGYDTPRPGESAAVDNIKIARAQVKQLTEELQKSRACFVPIQPIPANWTPGQEELQFKSQLSETLGRLRATARNLSVVVPTNPPYYFTFQSVDRTVKFARQSLRPLADQLGQIKAICDVLFAARVNEIINLKRQTVCPEDKPDEAGNDYLDQTAVTNELSGLKVVLTPFEMTFECFSPELAAVLVGFANSPHGFIVQVVDIKPAQPEVADTTANNPTPAFMSPTPSPRTLSPEARSAIAAQVAAQGGTGAEIARRIAEYEARLNAAPATRTSSPARPGSAAVINEKPVQVRLLVDTVRIIDLSSPGSRGGAPPGRAQGRPAN